jgi:hypothetical protein
VNKYLLIAGAMLPLFLTGCGRDSHDSLRKQQVLTIKETADALAAVHDSAETEPAKPKLKSLQEKWRDLEKRQKALPAIDSKETAELEKKHGDEMTGAGQRLAVEAVRVAGMRGGRDALKEASDIINQIGPVARETARKQQLAGLKEAADLLSTLKDKTSVDAARPKVKDMAERMRDIEQFVETLPAATPEEEAAIKHKYGDEFNGVKMRLGGEAVRVMFIPGGKELIQSAGEIKALQK